MNIGNILKQKGGIMNLKDQLIDAQNKYSGLFSATLVSDDNDYLLVEFCYNKKLKGLEFSANFEYETFFSDDVIKLNDNYFVIPFDEEYFDLIDYYFQQLADEIQEGYIFPNNLFFGDDEL